MLYYYTEFVTTGAIICFLTTEGFARAGAQFVEVKTNKTAMSGALTDGILYSLGTSEERYKDAIRKLGTFALKMTESARTFRESGGKHFSR